MPEHQDQLQHAIGMLSQRSNMLRQRQRFSVLLSLKFVPPQNPIPNLTGPNQLTRPSNPTANDCYNAVDNYPACANTTWIMYNVFDGPDFCCEPGQIASTQNGYGLCEPAGVAVPSNLLAPSVSQDTAAAPSTTIATTETETQVTGTATATATATVAVASTTTAATGANGTVAPSSKTSAVGTTMATTGSPAATGANGTVAQSSKTSAVGTTMATTGSPAAGSPSGSESASVSVSAKTGGGVGVSNSPTVVGAVFALCFGVGVAVLMG
jgi:hypothetical protein